MEKFGYIKGIRTERSINKKIIDELYSEGHLYAKYGLYARKTHGCKVFKVPMNAFFSCPNKDGRLSKDGCVFCPNFAKQFTYESFREVISADLKVQLEHQVSHYKKVGAGDKGFVYIAFGTNTYNNLRNLKKIYDVATSHEDIIGLMIGTRPDCLPDEVLDLLAGYVNEGYEIWLEIGQQSMHYHTMEEMNRQHGISEILRVVREAHKRGILCLMFVILGFYETPQEMIETARLISELGIDAVKIYPLLVMKNTKLSNEYKKGNYRPLGSLEYSTLVANFLESLSPYVLVQRLSKDCGLDGKVAPLWDSHRWIIAPRVEKILMLRHSKQGAKYKTGLSINELEPLY
ncbi:MAG: TIGR01212 family radical SAM protein [Candidatus Altiarchaeota archaeon]